MFIKPFINYQDGELDVRQYGRTDRCPLGLIRPKLHIEDDEWGCLVSLSY